MAKKTNVSRDVVLEMLKKMGASFTPDISTERAVKKLTRYVEKNGLPDDYTPAEVEVMVALNLAEVDPKEAAKAAKAAKSKAKKSSGKKDKAPAKKEAKPKAPKKPAVDWMVTATQAILKSNTMDAAADLAAKNYLKEGGRETPNNKYNGKLYTSYASKVLVVVGAVELGDNGKIIRK